MSTISSEVEHSPKTRLAFLNTMGSLHAEPVRYDLECLRSIVLNVAPDLLCADIPRDVWESGDLSAATLEVREVLMPVIAITDTVLVPVAPSPQQFGDYRAPPGWRQNLVHEFDRLLRWGQRKADYPEDIHGMAFETFCHAVCTLTEMSWTREDRAAWKTHNEALAENILQTIRRDPGRRVLVVVPCQWHHTLEPLLRRAEDSVEIVDYQEL